MRISFVMLFVAIVMHILLSTVCTSLAYQKRAQNQEKMQNINENTVKIHNYSFYLTVINSYCRVPMPSASACASVYVQSVDGAESVKWS